MVRQKGMPKTDSSPISRKIVAIIAVVLFISTVNIPSTFCQIPSPQLHSLELNAPPERALDVIFIPENYTLSEMDKFHDTVQKYYQALLSLEPFSKFRNSTNIWRIDTTEDFQPQRDSSMSRLLTVNYTKVLQLARNMTNADLDFVGYDDFVIVLVNDAVYGGSGAHDVAVAYTGVSGQEVMIHELGHSFGDLGDEYVLYDSNFTGSTIPYPNIDFDGSKWKDVPNTGAYLGAWYQNLVRPTYQSCIMRTLAYPSFCPVCSLALASILEKYSSGDTTPPTTTHNYDYSWHTADFTINLKATDNGSGVAATYYRMNSGSIQNVSISGQPFVNTEGANNTLEYWSVDMVGNEELQHRIFQIKLDKTPPNGSILINNGAVYTNQTTVNLALSATDTVSGLSQMRFSNDNISWTGWEQYTTSKSLNLQNSNGSKDVIVQFKDNAGLVSTRNSSIILDTIKPLANAGQNQTVFKGTNVTFNATGSTDNIGIKSYQWDFGDGATGTGIMTTHIYLDIGTYTAKLTIADGAGNIAASTASITVQENIIPEYSSFTFTLVAVFTISCAVIVKKKSKI